MIVYILGIITGLLLAAFLILIDVILHRKVHVGGLKGLIESVSKEKGEINIPAPEERLNWLDTLKRNDEAGIDTLLIDL